MLVRVLDLATLRSRKGVRGGDEVQLTGGGRDDGEVLTGDQGQRAPFARGQVTGVVEVRRVHGVHVGPDQFAHGLRAGGALALGGVGGHRIRVAPGLRIGHLVFCIAERVHRIGVPRVMVSTWHM